MSGISKKESQFEAELAAIKNELAAQRERYAALDGMRDEFAAIKNELAAQRERYGGLANEAAAIKDELAAQRERYGGIGNEAAEIRKELSAQRERYAGLNSESSALKNELASLRQSLAVLSQRQVVPLDDGLLAIRHEQGWIVTPQEDFAFAVHFADGRAWHEHGTVEVIRQLVREGDIAVDLGAHIGLHTLSLARAVGDSGKVIAVEPMPRTAECMRRALICNDLLGRCEIVVGAAGDTNGTAHFYLGDNSMLGSLFPSVDEHKLVEVREFRLDDLVGKDSRVDFVKMDVEGAELRALEGMRGLIARNDNIALVAEYGAPHLERVGIEPGDWFRAFANAGLGFCYRIDETSGALLAIDPDRLADLSSYNVLFVKNAQRAAARVAG